MSIDINPALTTEEQIRQWGVSNDPAEAKLAKWAIAAIEEAFAAGQANADGVDNGSLRRRAQGRARRGKGRQ